MMIFPGHGLGLLLGYLITGRLLSWQDMLFISLDCIFAIMITAIIIRHLIDHLKHSHYIITHENQIKRSDRI